MGKLLKNSWRSFFFHVLKKKWGKQRLRWDESELGLYVTILFFSFSRHFIPFHMSRSGKTCSTSFLCGVQVFSSWSLRLCTFSVVTWQLTSERNVIRLNVLLEMLWGEWRSVELTADFFPAVCDSMLICCSLSFTPLNMTAWIISSFSCFSSSRLVNSPTPLFPLC